LAVSWKLIEKILPVTDLMLIDIKGTNPNNHYRNTGIKPDNLGKY